MKKKLLSVTVAAAMVASCAGAVIAEDKNPTVFVDNSEIFFEDQKPVILGEGTTLVPARGVFEAMGAKVNWDGEKQLVEVTSADNQTLVRLTIGDSTMKVYDLSGMLGSLFLGQDFKAPETAVTLDVAPQILNDRTMIPLRAISEALNAQVDWNGEEYTIEIATGAPAAAETAPALSLSADTLSVKEGETVTIYVDAKNIPADTYVSNVTATVKYDPQNFEFEDAALINGNDVIVNATGESNPEFETGYLKAVYVTIDETTAAKTDGSVLKMTFKSLTGKEGIFQLSNGYHTELGFDTMLSATKGEESIMKFKGNSLNIDRTELKINSAEATPVPTEMATPIPAATLVPAESAEPSASPEATAEPTEAPEASSEPSASPAA